jgi:hypothetical protein
VWTHSRAGVAAAGIGVEGDAADDTREAALGVGVEGDRVDHDGAAAALVGEEVRAGAPLAHGRAGGAEHNEEAESKAVHVGVVGVGLVVLLLAAVQELKVR